MDYTDPDSGETYKVWDSNKMANDIIDHPDLKESRKNELLDKIIEYSTEYETKKSLSEKPNSSGATHYRDITAAQAIASRLKGPPDACS
ncbi:hypothetical protein BU26DRAFT_286241 [Trematosphaeria pertusa]|uniref:Uncharacterized protein n=1 Tax=Trematosphaeria pertusa TaxID=390896 RepID=A0A6A6IPZ0_9PLEO|nr:uncharacterized protein BU26DRAFT_286241 [Trematosphaeria pertusa]KAF2251563.1 hypothetical protein BU26DRAFT_286241 [Trematosphaeria pertusa]